jgi:hypothetical protein
VSGLSDPSVLSDRGINNWANSINFGTECLGFHLGGYQAANLGDGNGVLNQSTILVSFYSFYSTLNFAALGDHEVIHMMATSC